MSMDKLELLRRLMTEEPKEKKIKKQHLKKTQKTLRETPEKKVTSRIHRRIQKHSGKQGDAIGIRREVLETIYYLLSGRTIRASKLETLKAIRREVNRLISVLEGAE